MNLEFWRRPRITLRQLWGLFGREVTDWQSDYKRTEAADYQEREMLDAYKREKEGG